MFKKFYTRYTVLKTAVAAESLAGLAKTSNKDKFDSRAHNLVTLKITRILFLEVL